MNEAPIKRTQREWDSVFYTLAANISELSKDPDRKVGAVLVTADRRQMSFGYNGFPQDVPDLPSHLADKDFKLARMIHAEHNCLQQAPFPTKGCTLYVTRFPCHHCAELIAKAGVSRVMAPRPDYTHHRWGESWQQARWLMRFQNGIEIVH